VLADPGLVMTSYAIQITASKFLDKEREYKDICNLINGVISNNLE